MKRVYSNHLLQKNRSAVVLLMLVIVIAIIFILYAIDLNAIFQLSSEPAEKSTEPLPWEEESRLLKPGQPPQYKPFPEQPHIEKTKPLTAQVEQNRSPRGQMELLIKPDGSVEGNWKADYNYKRINYVMNADFKGNIDPSKIFQNPRIGKYMDKAEANPTKLYFIAKGKLIQIETNRKTNNVQTLNKILYVAGWLEPNFHANGKITTTIDKKTYEVFIWQTLR